VDLIEALKQERAPASAASVDDDDFICIYEGDDIDEDWE